MISVIIIAFNESDRIESTLRSLSWCEEVVVVDSGSTDGTQAIAEKLGARVVYRQFTGYGEQKQFACTLARHPWILSIDADEVLSHELSIEIQQAVQTESYHAYQIPRRFRFLGRTFTHGKSSVDYPTRLFRKDHAQFNSALVHESVIVEGTVSRLEAEMLHNSYRDIHHYFDKFNEYTTKAGQEMIKKGVHRSIILTVLSMPLYFIKHYLVGGHILNGKEGFVWSLFSSWYPVVKVAKLKYSNISKISR